MQSVKRNIDSESSSSALYEYDAFLSYRRVDGKPFARWLRTKLQGYRIPNILTPIRSPLRIYLDTTYEQANEDFWKNSIEPALTRSRYLIVVITQSVLQPRSDNSPNWVERETEYFSDLPQGHNILIALTSGTTEGPLPGRLKEKFPNMCVVDFSAFESTRLSVSRYFNLHERAITFLASLYEIPDTEMPLFRQEERRRKRKTIWFVASILLCALGITSFIGHTFKVQKNETAAAQTKSELGRALFYRRQVLLTLRLEVANLHNEATKHVMSENRFGQEPPHSIGLRYARKKVSDFLPAVDRISKDSNGKWQELYKHLVSFIEITRDSRNFALDDSKQFRIINKDIDELNNEVGDELEALR